MYVELIKLCLVLYSLWRLDTAVRTCIAVPCFPSVPFSYVKWEVQVGGTHFSCMNLLFNASNNVHAV